MLSHNLDLTQRARLALPLIALLLLFLGYGLPKLLPKTELIEKPNSKPKIYGNRTSR